MVQPTRKGSPFNWSKDCEKAFDQLKQCLVTASVLAFSQDEGLYVLDTDASGFGIDAVLSQVQAGDEKVVSYVWDSHTCQSSRGTGEECYSF